MSNTRANIPVRTGWQQAASIAGRTQSGGSAGVVSRFSKDRTASRSAGGEPVASNSFKAGDGAASVLARQVRTASIGAPNLNVVHTS